MYHSLCRFQLGLFSFSFLTSLISSFPFGLPYVEVLFHNLGKKRAQQRDESIVNVVEQATKPKTRNLRLHLPFLSRSKKTKIVAYGDHPTTKSHRNSAVLVRRTRSVLNQQDYRPRRLRQILWYSPFTRQHFILQLSTVLHFQC